jgi:hypothetical protein
MFREIMAIRTSQMMTSRSLIFLLEDENGGKLQKTYIKTRVRFAARLLQAGVSVNDECS